MPEATCECSNPVERIWGLGNHTAQPQTAHTLPASKFKRSQLQSFLFQPFTVKLIEMDTNGLAYILIDKEKATFFPRMFL
jgi:hypothetical protein